MKFIEPKGDIDYETVDIEKYVKEVRGKGDFSCPYFDMMPTGPGPESPVADEPIIVPDYDASDYLSLIDKSDTRDYNSFPTLHPLKKTCFGHIEGNETPKEISAVISDNILEFNHFPPPLPCSWPTDPRTVILYKGMNGPKLPIYSPFYNGKNGTDRTADFDTIIRNEKNNDSGSLLSTSDSSSIPDMSELSYVESIPEKVNYLAKSIKKKIISLFSTASQ